MTEQNTIDAYEKAIALSNPPITINQGTKNEYQVFTGKRGGSQFQQMEKRNRHLANKDWAEDVWVICNPDAELANAVMDYASSLIN